MDYWKLPQFTPLIKNIPLAYTVQRLNLIKTHPNLSTARGCQDKIDQKIW